MYGMSLSQGDGGGDGQVFSLPYRAYAAEETMGMQWELGGA